MKVRNTIVGMMGLAVAATSVLSASRAQAALTLTLSEPGFAVSTFTDAGNTGAISYFGPYGDFQTNFVAGLSDKLTSSVGPATLQLQSINVKSLASAGVSKTLTITLTDDGYTFPGATGLTAVLDSSFGGTFTGANAGDTATFQSFVVAPPTTTGLQSYTAPVSDPGTTSFSTNVVPVNFTRPAAYTLTNTTTVTLTGGYEQANLSGTTTVRAVPEPTTITGVIGIAGTLLARRSRRH